ncbi:glycoside hydrolase family 18 protein [Annulohypoxylon moriforme]|nr:glycoside hydrolase family 18 protein [Annulohypoxylon moriforme]
MSNPTPAPTPLNTVYYPSWRVYKGFPPSSLQLDRIDQIYYAFVRLSPDGTLKYLDEYADLTKPVDGETGCLRALAKLKQQKPTLKTLISVGGGSGSAEFPAVAADPALRSTFANACKQFVDEYRLDGVDIDWEHPTAPSDGANYILLLRALRSVLPSPQYLLTTALPVGEYCLKNIDIPTLAQLLDSLNLMGYDFNGPWTDVCGHHAQLLRQPGDERAIHPSLRQSCHRGASFFLANGFPASKIVLGVPAYARSFTGARGVGQPFSGAAELDYNELPPEWIQNAVVDENVAAASYVDNSPGGKGFVSFDVPRTVRIKAEYVRQMGLGGLFYWTGVGDVNGPNSLVAAGYDVLNRR